MLRAGFITGQRRLMVTTEERELPA